MSDQNEPEKAEVIRIGGKAYLKSMLSIVTSAFTHPFKTTVIDLTTGDVVGRFASEEEYRRQTAQADALETPDEKNRSEGLAPTPPGADALKKGQQPYRDQTGPSANPRTPPRP